MIFIRNIWVGVANIVATFNVSCYNQEMNMTVKEMVAVSALHHHNSKWLPYKTDINVYRGCSHRCIYCYALYSHEYIGGNDFYGEIFAKTNIADVLRCELSSYSREPVNLGGVSDSYQHAEREYQLMPKVLKLLAEYRVPVNISTKSMLILRDIDLLLKIDEANALNTALTITTMNETVAKLIEPGAPSPEMRMNTVKELRNNGIHCGVHIMPIIPYLSSDEQNIEAIFNAAKEAGAEYVLAGALNLKGQTKSGFFENVRQSFPSEYKKIRALYQDKRAYHEYKIMLHKTLERLRNQYGMPYYKGIPKQNKPEQLSFLPD